MRHSLFSWRDRPSGDAALPVLLEPPEGRSLLRVWQWLAQEKTARSRGAVCVSLWRDVTSRKVMFVRGNLALSFRVLEVAGVRGGYNSFRRKAIWP
jgi:hypothetical protein